MTEDSKDPQAAEPTPGDHTAAPHPAAASSSDHAAPGVHAAPAHGAAQPAHPDQVWAPGYGAGAQTSAGYQVPHYGAAPAGYGPNGPATEQFPAGTEQLPVGAYGQTYAASGAGYAQGGHQHTAPIFGGPNGPGGPPVGPGQPGGQGFPGAPAPKKSARTGLVVGAIALALLSGGIGGAVGSLATRSDTGQSVTNALDAPYKASEVANAPAGSVQAVAQKVLPSVVMIRVAGNKAEGEGSGVVLSTDGKILTNNHVVSGAGPNARMEVAFSDGTTAPATLIGADPVSDLAVIKVSDKKGLVPVELGASGNLQVGQSVVAIGSPLGLAGTVTTGIVSSLNRPVSTSGEAASQGTVINAIQTDAAINPGNSGGALVDMNGKLIGINTAIATLGVSEAAGGQSGSIGLGFAIPVDQARRVADELIKNGKATYAQIGVKVRAQDDVNGARVLEVTPDGPAAKAGLPNGAIVTKLDDQVIDSGNALIAGVRSHRPGDKVKVTYTDDQGNNQKTVEITLGEAAVEGGR